jgi:catechol 2,3-dioxygenase-like lactoylglutathione lyase family enzyme
VTTRPRTAIDRIALIVSDLDRAEDDYVRTFGCRVEQRAAIEPALTRVLCLRPARGRRSLLRLGRQRIELLEFTDSAGRPYPPDSTSTDLWFQHMAIVVSDMGCAHQRVMANRGLRPISRNGPVRLPAGSAGVTAFKFRDALDDIDDVHVSVTPLAPGLPAPRLELLHYHAGTRRPIPHDTASNDIAATHSVVRVASLDVTAAALERRGTPLTGDGLMILRGGMRAALISGPDGHRFLVEEQAVPNPGHDLRTRDS